MLKNYEDWAISKQDPKAREGMGKLQRLAERRRTPSGSETGSPSTEGEDIVSTGKKLSEVTVWTTVTVSLTN